MDSSAAAFFDLDHTIIAKSAMHAFRQPLYAGGLLDRRSLLRALFAEAVYLHLGADDRRLARMRELILKVTRGWPRDEVVMIIDEALERIVNPIIYAEAVELIAEHQAAGRRVVIVSASPEEIVLPLARHLGVADAIASRAAIDAEGRYTGAMAFYAFGADKAVAMKEFAQAREIDLGRSYAYSDSASDLPMLETVGNPVAVNPDRLLQRNAAERGWEIRHFEKPVSLGNRVRDRVHLLPAALSAVTATVLGVGALVLGGWFGYRRRRPNH